LGGAQIKKSALLFLGILVSLAILFCSCGPTKATDYYPLEVGNRWVYQTTDLESKELRTDQDLITKRENRTYFFDTGERIINLTNASLVNRNGFVILQTPFSVNSKWHEENIIVEITDKGKRYEVPAGTFSDTLEVAWEIKRADEKDPSKIYLDITVYRYAKNVGPIYYYYEVQQPDGKRVPVFQSELVEFSNIRNKK
jgi:hypothetical protein